VPVTDILEALTAATNKAQALRDAGNLTAALDVDQRNLALCRARLGDYHPWSLATRLAVGVDLAALSRHDEALVADEAALRDARLALGEDHPTTLMAAMHVAAGYAALGRASEALELGQETLRRYKRVLGDDHPATRLCAENLQLAT
jgi:tetratricopeptide (TPR) repeat protein